MHDLAIIGAGAAGLAAVKQAVKVGLKTILLEGSKEGFGGTCLNRGCIPVKFYLNQAKLGKAWDEITPRKDQMIAAIKEPLLTHLQQSGVDILWGQASFLDKNTLLVSGEKIQAKNIIIASGSRPRQVIPGEKVVFAEDLFSLAQLPDKFLVVGGGALGVEVASLLNKLGRQVHLVEKEERILLGFSARLAKRFRIILETKGIKIATGKTISDYNLDEFDLVVLAAGREPNSQELGLERIGLTLDERGWIKTDKHLRTNVDNIYACGDITGKLLLAYAAEYQAQLCVKNIDRGRIGTLHEEDYSGLPECVFAFPQIARVGVLEESAKETNPKARVIKSNFLRFSSSYAYGDHDGFIQLIVDEQDTLIGAELISNLAGELINLLSLCLRSRLPLKKLQDSLFIHPTLSEIIPLLLRD